MLVVKELLKTNPERCCFAATLGVNLFVLVFLPTYSTYGTSNAMK